MFKLSKRKEGCILTTEGYIVYERNIYVPANEFTMAVLMETYGRKTYVPLDIYLGIDRFPFRVTTGMALRIAFVGAKTISYAAAEEFFLAVVSILGPNDGYRAPVLQAWRPSTPCTQLSLDPPSVIQNTTLVLNERILSDIS